MAGGSPYPSGFVGDDAVLGGFGGGLLVGPAVRLRLRAVALGLVLGGLDAALSCLLVGLIRAGRIRLGRLVGLALRLLPQVVDQLAGDLAVHLGEGLAERLVRVLARVDL